MLCCKEDGGQDHNNDLNTGMAPTLAGIWQAARTADSSKSLTTGCSRSNCYLSKLEGAKSAGIFSPTEDLQIQGSVYLPELYTLNNISAKNKHKMLQFPLSVC